MPPLVLREPRRLGARVEQRRRRAARAGPLDLLGQPIAVRDQAHQHGMDRDPRGRATSSRSSRPTAWRPGRAGGPVSPIGPRPGPPAPPARRPAPRAARSASGSRRPSRAACGRWRPGPWPAGAPAAAPGAARRGRTPPRPRRPARPAASPRRWRSDPAAPTPAPPGPRGRPAPRRWPSSPRPIRRAGVRYDFPIFRQHHHARAAQAMLEGIESDAGPRLGDSGGPGRAGRCGGWRRSARRWPSSAAPGVGLGCKSGTDNVPDLAVYDVFRAESTPIWEESRNSSDLGPAHLPYTGLPASWPSSCFGDRSLSRSISVGWPWRSEPASRPRGPATSHS